MSMTESHGTGERCPGSSLKCVAMAADYHDISLITFPYLVIRWDWAFRREQERDQFPGLKKHWWSFRGRHGLDFQETHPLEPLSWISTACPLIPFSRYFYGTFWLEWHGGVLKRCMVTATFPACSADAKDVFSLVTAVRTERPTGWSIIKSS